MPLKIDKRCKICQTITHGESGAVLLERLYNSSKFRTNGETLKAIHDDYADKFSYLGLTNHMKRHQFIDEAAVKRKVQKELEDKGTTAVAAELLTTDSVRQEIMKQGVEGIKSGDIKIRASDVVKAAKDQDDINAKRGDQALQAAELMMRIASGELKPTGEMNGESPRRSVEGQVITQPVTSEPNSGSSS